MCIFCGSSGPLTGEHVWPAWLDKVLLGDKGRIRYRAGTVRPGEPHEAREWNTIGFDQRANMVCGDCNHGWMSQLEAAVEPVLTPMIKGDPVTLTREEQALVALWVAKTVCVADQLYGPEDRSIPLSDARYIYEHREPPPNSLIWLAAFVEEAEEAMVGSHKGFKMALGEGVVGYGATLTVGAFVAQVFGSPVPLEDPYPIETLEMIEPIWPTRETVSWPPTKVLTRAALEGLSAAPHEFD